MKRHAHKFVGDYCIVCNVTKQQAWEAFMIVEGIIL